jgi:hypothetical protein
MISSATKSIEGAKMSGPVLLHVLFAPFVLFVANRSATFASGG